MKPWHAIPFAATGTLALALLPLAAPPYYATLMIPFFGYAIALLGFNLLFGYTGLLSLGHAMFFAAGLYGAGLSASLLGWSAAPAFIAGIIWWLLFGHNGGGIVISVLVAAAIVYLIRRSRGGDLHTPGRSP